MRSIRAAFSILSILIYYIRNIMKIGNVRYICPLLIFNMRITQICDLNNVYSWIIIGPLYMYIFFVPGDVPLRSLNYVSPSLY